MKATLWKLIHKWRDATTTEAAWIARDQIDIELDKIDALKVEAARYTAKRKEIFMKRNRMQVSGPRSTEDEFNAEYDANCDKARAGYIADHRGVLVFDAAMKGTS